MSYNLIGWNKYVRRCSSGIQIGGLLALFASAVIHGCPVKHSFSYLRSLPAGAVQKLQEKRVSSSGPIYHQ
jgi:hypothetical protein